MKIIVTYDKAKIAKEEISKELTICIRNKSKDGFLTSKRPGRIVVNHSSLTEDDFYILQAELENESITVELG